MTRVRIPPVAQQLAGMAERPRHRPSKPDTRVRFPLPAPFTGACVQRARRLPLKQQIRVRLPVPLHSRRDRSIGRTPGSDPGDDRVRLPLPLRLGRLPARLPSPFRGRSTAEHLAVNQARRKPTCRFDSCPRSHSRCVLAGPATGCNPAWAEFDPRTHFHLHGAIVQRSGHRPLTSGIAGSNLRGVTICSVRLRVRSAAFQAAEAGSTPARSASNSV